MAFSEADKTAVEGALRNLALGQRVVRMTVAGKTMEFGEAQMSDLRDLLSQINGDLAAAEPAPSYVLTRTSKGL
jgi:hypothetical protein